LLIYFSKSPNFYNPYNIYPFYNLYFIENHRHCPQTLRSRLRYWMASEM